MYTSGALNSFKAPFRTPEPLEQYQYQATAETLTWERDDCQVEVSLRSLSPDVPSRTHEPAQSSRSSTSPRRRSASGLESAPAVSPAPVPMSVLPTSSTLVPVPGISASRVGSAMACLREWRQRPAVPRLQLGAAAPEDPPQAALSSRARLVEVAQIAAAAAETALAAAKQAAAAAQELSPRSTSNLGEQIGQHQRPKLFSASRGTPGNDSASLASKRAASAGSTLQRQLNGSMSDPGSLGSHVGHRGPTSPGIRAASRSGASEKRQPLGTWKP